MAWQFCHGCVTVRVLRVSLRGMQRDPGQGKGLLTSLLCREVPLPVQFRMPVPATAAEALAEIVSRAAALTAASGGNLLECFAAVPDQRDPHGIRHSLPSVLALCTAAVLCGNTAMEDVTAWVHAAPQEILAAAGARRNALGICVAPHPDTVVRIFTAWVRSRSRTTQGRTWPCARCPARSPAPSRGRDGCRPSR